MCSTSVKRMMEEPMDDEYARSIVENRTAPRHHVIWWCLGIVVLVAILLFGGGYFTLK